MREKVKILLKLYNNLMLSSWRSRRVIKNQLACIIIVTAVVNLSSSCYASNTYDEHKVSTVLLSQPTITENLLSEQLDSQGCTEKSKNAKRSKRKRQSSDEKEVYLDTSCPPQAIILHAPEKDVLSKNPSVEETLDTRPICSNNTEYLEAIITYYKNLMGEKAEQGPIALFPMVNLRENRVIEKITDLLPLNVHSNITAITQDMEVNCLQAYPTLKCADLITPEGELIITLEKKKGDSGAHIWLLKVGTAVSSLANSIGALKIYDKAYEEQKKSLLIELGIVELANSLVVSNIHNGDQGLKIAEVIGAAKHGEGKTPLLISIISKSAPGQEIYNFFKNNFNNQKKIKQALESIANHLALFHQKFSCSGDQIINYYIKHIAKLQAEKFHSFLKYYREELKSIAEKEFKGDRFENCLLETYNKFREENYYNTELLSKKINFTLTHGDLHGGNIFYEENSKVVTIIDYGTIMRTYNGENVHIGDAAEDVGRFIGSLWTWSVGKGISAERIGKWEKYFVNKYINQSKEKAFIFDENFFRENTKFYKQKFYHFKFKQFSDSEKQQLFELWMEDINQNEGEKNNG